MLITIFLTSILIEALNKQVKAVVVFNDVRSIHRKSKIFKMWHFWCCFNLCDFMVRYITEILSLDSSGILNNGRCHNCMDFVWFFLVETYVTVAGGKTFIFPFQVYGSGYRFSKYCLYCEVIDV